MRARLLVFLALVALGIGLWFLGAGEDHLPAPATVKRSAEPRPNATKTSTSTNADETSHLQRLEELRENFHREWSHPIEFYGKVVDENGDPVEGAKVEFGWTDTSEDGHSEATTLSDADGLFSLKRATGKRLGVEIKKDGYYTSWQKNQFSFEYSNTNESIYHEPDASNPVVFHLKKKGEAEALIRLQKHFKVPKDGTAVEVDILHGKPVAEGFGHVKVQCWTDPQQKNAQGLYERGYNWRCILTIPDGGVVERDGEFDFLAPEHGYGEFLEVNMPKGMERWTSDVERKVFIRAANGAVFARGIFRMIAAGGHSFYLELDINPSGSRNLEYAKEKEITQQRIGDVGLGRALEEARQRRPKTAEEEAEERRHLMGQPMGTAPE